MKINALLKVLAVFTGLFIIGSAAHAGLVDQYTTGDAEYANVYQNGTSVNVTIEGAGVNRKVSLSHSSYSYGTGSVYWSGEIPADAVTVNGVAQISVYVDTCNLPARVSWGANPCGLVDVTFDKVDRLWKTNGVRQYQWGDLIYQIVGGITTFSAQSTGTVRGVNVDSTRAYMGQYNNVSVQVNTAN
jgi:hypothetical protein